MMLGTMNWLRFRHGSEKKCVWPNSGTQPNQMVP